jgi:ribose transport system permease protein
VTTTDEPVRTVIITTVPDRTGWQQRAVSVVRDYGIVLWFAAIFFFLTFKSPVFFSTDNFRNLLYQSTSIGLIAAAGTLLLISGGFDLSVGATFALAGVVAAKMAGDVPVPVALLIGVLVGLMVGIVNGLLTTVGRINPLVATLASSIVISGVAFVLTKGLLVNVTDPSFKTAGLGKLAGVHYQSWIWIGFALLCGGILTFTTFGRYIYAAGGNPEAARLSGIRVGLVRTSTYGLSGLSAGLAGVLIASQVATGQADAGATLPLGAVAAIVVGGTSIWGGEGAIWRTVLGVLLLALISNGFNLLQVDPTYQQILQGLIILSAVGFDAWTRRTT